MNDLIDDHMASASRALASSRLGHKVELEHATDAYITVHFSATERN